MQNLRCFRRGYVLYLPYNIRNPSWKRFLEALGGRGLGMVMLGVRKSGLPIRWLTSYIPPIHPFPSRRERIIRADKSRRNSSDVFFLEEKRDGLTLLHVRIEFTSTAYYRIV